ncbi:SCO family protein [uncultured Gemmobacter sp.]|uniref:SCO family protein n=1 Tax=uncultured Gemmobacter sp. TaxID=1095917 RepID=UPI0025942C15|nr:SCO family protein [uncultured Gemmobacter sp.]
MVTEIVNRRTVLTTAAAAVAAAGSMLALGWWRSQPRNGRDLLPVPISDMDFTLTDHRGRSFAPAQWLGRPTMAFFGFTFCPDICPTTLFDISDWLAELGPDADRLNVALISVDPERDSPAALADYLSNFDPRIVGLTGALPEIEKAASGFRAKFEKLPRDGDYTMNHTAGVFLFDADGLFTSIIDFHEDRRFAIPKIRRSLP